MLTTKHYELLLGLDKNWEVNQVDLNVQELRVDIHVKYIGKEAACPECGKECSFYDHSPERQWRHLDTMQFLTTIHASVPRVSCETHKVKTIEAPWAGKHSRFTLLFEAFAIKIIEGARSISDAQKILRLGWKQIQTIMASAVERGMERREADEIAWVGMDEKSFRKGHRYISVMSDIDGRRILEVVEGRSSEVAEKLITEGLNPFQREMVCGVAMDMSAPYEAAVESRLPNADIIFDKFHIVRHLADAVDSVRKTEHARLQKKGDDRLKKTKYLWLKGFESMSDDAKAKLEDLRRQSLDVAKAWHIKNMFADFWTRRDKDFARRFFDFWYNEALSVKLRPIRKVAAMLKRHLENIVTYFDCYITNAITEGFNSKIQAIKANARGFRNFSNYRTSILFFCGRLSLYP
jgi:transposase